MSEPVVVKSGEVLRFPVAPEHPLASSQQQIGVSQLKDVKNLAVSRRMIRANPSLSADQVSDHLNSMLAAAKAGSILQVVLPDVIVHEGAILQFDGPISALTAGNVIVLGQILAEGSFDLTCTSLGSILPPTITGISPSTGSTLGGTEVNITGTGFDATTEVFFGGTPAASVNAINSALNGVCMAVAPPAANAGAVHITVRTNKVLTSASTSAPVFTYVYIPGVASVSFSTQTLWAGESCTGTITLDEPAPAGGLPLTLQSTVPQGVTVPARVTSPAGATAVTFPVTSSASAAEGMISIGATGPDGTIQGASLMLFTGQITLDWQVEEAGMISGTTYTRTVWFRTPAPASGGLITLSTSDPRAVKIPASVTLAPGSTSASFTITALPVTQLVAGVYIGVTYGDDYVASPPIAVGPHGPDPVPPPKPTPGPTPGPNPV